MLVTTLVMAHYHINCIKSLWLYRRILFTFRAFKHTDYEALSYCFLFDFQIQNKTFLLFYIYNLMNEKSYVPHLTLCGCRFYCLITKVFCAHMENDDCFTTYFEENMVWMFVDFLNRTCPITKEYFGCKKV